MIHQLNKYVILGIALMSGLIRVPFDMKQFHIVDEAVIASLANIILRGGLVYRDGWCHRGPMLDYVYAGIFTLFGSNNMVAVHLITSALVVLQTLLVYKVSTQLFSQGIALAASLFFGFFSTFGYLPTDTLGSNVEIWMNFFILAGLCLMISSLKRKMYLAIFLSALVVGFATITKQVAFLLYPFLVVLVVFPHVWGLQDSSDKNHILKKLTGATLVSVGFFLPVAMTIFYYYYKNALNDFISLFVSYNFFYIQSFFMTAPGFELTPILDRAFKSFIHILIVNFSPMRSGLLFTLTLITLAIVLIDIKKQVPILPKLHRQRLCFVFVWLLFSTLPILALGRGFGHYYIQLLPVASILAAFTLWTVFVEWQALKSYRPLLIIVLFILFVVPVINFLNKEPFAQDKNIHDISAYIMNNSNKEDKIFVWGWNTELYPMTNRINASRFIFCTFLTNETPGGNMTGLVSKNIGFQDAQDLWLLDLKSSKPKFIIDGHRGALLYEFYPLTRYPDVFDFISKNYRISRVVGNYHILEKIADD